MFSGRSSTNILRMSKFLYKNIKFLKDAKYIKYIKIKKNI